MVKAYVAGPLFTPAERSYLEKIDILIKELKIETYLPHRDGYLIRTESQEVSKRIFEADKIAVNDCDFVVGVLNGSKVDDGTAWELGYAYALGKPIIAIIEDTRIRVLTNLNPMLLNSVKLTRSFAELKEALKNL